MIETRTAALRRFAIAHGNVLRLAAETTQAVDAKIADQDVLALRASQVLDGSDRTARDFAHSYARLRQTEAKEASLRERHAAALTEFNAAAKILAVQIVTELMPPGLVNVVRTGKDDWPNVDVEFNEDPP